MKMKEIQLLESAREMREFLEKWLKRRTRPRRRKRLKYYREKMRRNRIAKRKAMGLSQWEYKFIIEFENDMKSAERSLQNVVKMSERYQYSTDEFFAHKLKKHEAYIRKAQFERPFTERGQLVYMIRNRLISQETSDEWLQDYYSWRYKQKSGT
jgi:hypothetical protein